MGLFTGSMIITDLDGTLLNSKKYVDDYSRQMINEYINGGGRFTFATGRLYQSFVCVRDRLVYNAPIVFANGAQIIDFDKEEILSECPLEPDVVGICSDVIDRFPGTSCEVYRHRLCDIVCRNEITPKHMIDFKVEHTAHQSLSEIPTPWIKVLFTNDHASLEKAAAYFLSKYDKAYARFSSPFFLEIFNSSTDKGKGTLRLADMLGIDRSRIYAAGDQENDLDLLAAASISFAPENAVPAVKSVANVILPDNDHDTMAALIRYISVLQRK